MSRILRAMGAQMATQSLRIAQQILLIPFFLKVWGIGTYTDWLLINSGIAALSIFDGGMQPYFSGLLRVRLVQGDIAGYRRAASIATFSYLLVITVALLTIGAASFFIDWPSLFGMSHLPNREGHMTAALLCANALLLLPFGVAGSLYSAHGEYDRSVLAGMGNLAIQIIVPLILLAFRQPTTVLAAGMIACTLVGWTAVSIDERIRYGPLPWGLAAPTAAELRLTVSNGLYFTAQPITTWLTIQGPILILGHLGAPAATVAFATARTLIGVGRQITLQLAYPFGFELSVLLVREELFALRRLLKNAVSIIGIIGGMLSGVMVVAGAPVMKLWLRGRIEPSLSLIIALAIPVALGASAQLYQLMLMFSNRPRLIAVGVSVYAAVGLSLALALMPAFGATGVAAGLGAGEIAVLVGYLPSRTLKMIGTTDGSLQLDGVARAAVGAGLSFVIARLAAFIVPPSDYLRLIAFSGLWGLAAAPTAFFVLLDPEQRAIIRRSIRARR